MAACSVTLASIMMVKVTATWRLDASTFFSSVPDFIPRRFWRFHFMKNLVIGITLATLAAPAFAQNPPALKDTKDKVSYSIGLDIGTRRIGVALSDSAGTLATPYEVVQRSGDELKLVWPQAGMDPEALLGWDFRHFLIQPMDCADAEAARAAAIDYVLAHPEWRLSLQTHKLLGLP